MASNDKLKHKRLERRFGLGVWLIILSVGGWFIYMGYAAWDSVVMTIGCLCVFVYGLGLAVQALNDDGK